VSSKVDGLRLVESDPFVAGRVPGPREARRCWEAVEVIAQLLRHLVERLLAVRSTGAYGNRALWPCGLTPLADGYKESSTVISRAASQGAPFLLV
jgi:hypothetical protein